ncbi:uncharacterized protein LOC116776407 [Danaus plexippus]|uniref:uncharacterized protein LOC116776407 n=1 Tax=Danaus plexippus TaxID=13037 RepID=UPI002AB17AEE|nr:uncharacterized protein LOC116776407 [Danaus plexippus]
MILYQNKEIFVSIFIYFVVKILCKVVSNYRSSMCNKQPTLTSIPEKNELIDEVVKWVPKKKHEVLKAKYKCLKKLFQIYDASVIGLLPESYTLEDQYPQVPEQGTCRRKRSRRTKTDACAGTTELSSGDVSEQYGVDRSVPESVIKDLNFNEYSSSELNKSKVSICKIKDESTQDSKENLSINDREYDYTPNPHRVPHLVISEKRKLSRFQSFIHRILGIRRQRNYTYVLSTDRTYAASDNNITNRYEKRKRRGLRFRRHRRPKKIQSEIALTDAKSPVILSYVQSLQRNCLMDTTARQCPIVGCKMISYGIINYNDHLNICHFSDRKFICIYCHEGFNKEHDKIVHENEHIGISKLNIPSMPSTARFSTKIASDTQTDPELTKAEVPEDKLRKIVSFFDKLSDPDQIVAEIKKKRYSESHLETLHHNPTIDSDGSKSDMSSNRKSDSDKVMSSCVNLQPKTLSKLTTSLDSEITSNIVPLSPVRCQFCGENFDFRRQLSLHVELEHRLYDKFSKFHSCAGIINRENRKIRKTSDATLARASSTGTEVSRCKSNETLSCDPSTNIVYYTSMESIHKKPSIVNSIVQKVRSGFMYKWEPGTKIIRV